MPNYLKNKKDTKPGATKTDSKKQIYSGLRILPLVD